MPMPSIRKNTTPPPAGPAGMSTAQLTALITSIVKSQLALHKKGGAKYTHQVTKHPSGKGFKVTSTPCE